MPTTPNISTTHFMGWDQPALISASRIIIEQYQNAAQNLNQSEIDLSTYQIVVPGRRAARGLLGAIVDHAAELGLPLIPPLIVTPADLPALLLQFPANQAPESHRRIAWIQSLSELSTDSPERISGLLPSPPEADQWDKWINIADWLDQLTDELSQSCLRMDSVAEIAQQSTKLQLDESELERWETLGYIQQSYEQKLDDHHFVDARLAALNGYTKSIDSHEIHSGEFSNPLPLPLKESITPKLILCGVPDLTPLTRSLLNHVISTTNTELQALVFAPDSYAEHFDEFGCVLTNYWSTCEIGIEEDHIHFSETTEDLCTYALAKLGTIAQPLETSQAVIGLADESLAGPIKRQALLIHDTAGHPITIHTPAGHKALLSSPGQLLKRIREYRQDNTFQSLVDLIMHPDVQDALTYLYDSIEEGTSIKVDSPPRPEAFWLNALDALRDQHLQTSSTAFPSSAQEWVQSDAQWVLDAILQLLAPLNESPQRAPLNEWMERLIRCYQLIYATTDLTDLPATSTLVQSLESMNQVCTHLTQAYIDGFNIELLEAHEAIAFVLAELSKKQFPEHIDRQAIESLGWLELAMDPAPNAVVIGMNDSTVPGSITHDPILPNSLREALGMRTNAHRLARDAYLMQSIYESREASFACARTGSNNEPTIPSRLLFKTTGKALAQRVQRFVDHEYAHNTAQPRLELADNTAHADSDPFAMNITVEPGYQPPDSMSVTDFDAYLRSPAAWYIERHLKLKEPMTKGKELSHMHIGNLVHAAFEEYGKNPEYRDLTDEQAIYDTLTSLLEIALHNQHGPDLQPAVRIQHELLKYRLQWFASHQAARIADGWKIINTEWSPSTTQQPSLIVDGLPMRLRGKIDRIDQHTDGRIAIIDYKTGQVSDATKGHLKGEQWIKLQLPLYRHLAEPLIKDFGVESSHIELGYAGLPAQSDAHVWSFASWSDIDLQGADEAAYRVIREIRSLTPGTVLPLGDHPPEHGVMGFISGRRFSGGGGEPANDNTDPDSIITDEWSSESDGEQ